MTEPAPRSRVVVWVMRLALLIGLAGMIATIIVVGPRTLAGHLRAIGPWFALLVALDVGATAIDATALHALVVKDRAPSWRRVVVAQLAGRAVNAVTPGGGLGEALKASLLAEHGRGTRMVAAVMACGLINFGLALATIGVGAPLTVVWLGVDGGARVALVVASGVAIALLLGMVVLVRRGMLAGLADAARAVHVISRTRHTRWAKRLAAIDTQLAHLRKAPGWRRALICLAAAKLVGWSTTWIAVAAAGYRLAPAEFVGLISAGVVLGWLGSLVPMGLGVSESGSYGVFSLIGAPATVGVSLALAGRVRQIIIAGLGFGTLGVVRLVDRRRALRSTPRRGWLRRRR